MVIRVQRHDWNGTDSVSDTAATSVAGDSYSDDDDDGVDDDDYGLHADGQCDEC